MVSPYLISLHVATASVLDSSEEVDVPEKRSRSKVFKLLPFVLRSGKEDRATEYQLAVHDPTERRSWLTLIRHANASFAAINPFK